MVVTTPHQSPAKIRSGLARLCSWAWPVHCAHRLDMAEDDHCTAVHVARGCIRERLFSTKLDPTHEVRSGPRGRGREVTLLSNESTPQSRKEAYRYW